MTVARHILSIALEHQPGALARVVQMFAARGYNIDSLTVARTEDPTLTHMTLVTNEEASLIEQILKQINKIIDVHKITDITAIAHVERELMMVKVKAEGIDLRSELLNLSNIFRGCIVEVTAKIFIIEVTGTSDKMDAFLTALPKGCIIDTVRTGVSGLARG